MDWAEELKMSIRKTTARKGRRSKSRDPNGPSSSSSGTIVTSPNVEKEISIDITLDKQLNIGSTSDSSIAIPSTSSSYKNTNEAEGKRPPLRRISGGWADTGGLKGLKTKKGSNSFDDERFQYPVPKSITPPLDDIPIIPDLDDIKDEILLNEIVEPPSVSVNRAVTLKELNSDLLSQNAFSSIEDCDLSILTRCLQSQDNLDEADEIWEWDKLFTDVIAEIHTDKAKRAGSAGEKADQIGTEDLPPIMYA